MVVVDGWTWSWRCFPTSTAPWLNQSDPGGPSQIQPRNLPGTGGLGCEATNMSWFSGSPFFLWVFYRAAFWLGYERWNFIPNKFPWTKGAIPEPQHQPQRKALPKDPFQTPRLEILHFPYAVPCRGTSQQCHPPGIILMEIEGLLLSPEVAAVTCREQWHD